MDAPTAGVEPGGPPPGALPPQEPMAPPPVSDPEIADVGMSVFQAEAASCERPNASPYCPPLARGLCLALRHRASGLLAERGEVEKRARPLTTGACLRAMQGFRTNSRLPSWASACRPRLLACFC